MQASPYIAGHRGRTFVLVIPGEVVQNEAMLQGILQDVALVHELGVRLVLIVGCAELVSTFSFALPHSRGPPPSVATPRSWGIKEYKETKWGLHAYRMRI